MQFPIDFHILGKTIDSHFVFETLAFIIGFRYFLYLRKRQKDPYSDYRRALVTTMAAFGALLGSRILGILENPILLAEHSGNLLFYFSTKTVLGGFLGGLAATEITKKAIGIHYSSGDLLTYPILLALIIGRIGCFLSGIEDATHGIPSSLPWAMDLGDGIHRHPTALYEILYLCAVWMGIRLMDQFLTLIDGAKFQLFMVAYLIFRFGSEYIKPVYFWPIGLSTIQIASIAGILYYWKTLLMPWALWHPRTDWHKDNP